MRKFVSIFMLSLLFVSVARAESALPTPSPEALQTIRPEAIRAHMQFLSDDLMEGRETGTRGYTLAANYIRSQFQTIGLKPGGTNGSYFQQVPLRRSRLVRDQSSVVVNRNGKKTKLAWEQDFAMRGNSVYEKTAIEAPVVFVGYGVSAPQFNHDDYANVDVKGKIVMVLYGAPASLPSSERAHFSPTDQKQKMAAAHGAAGFLTVWAGDQEKRTPFKRFAGFVQSPRMRWLDAKGQPSEVNRSIRGEAYLSSDAARKLFDGAPQTFDQALAAAVAGKTQAFQLPVTVAINAVSQFETLQSPNVAGILTGSDPKLKDEYVLYTAHADHLGIGEPKNGDSIYNGALDNASGTAALIEMARAFVAVNPQPRRSIMFVAVTGEEEGLLGSEYFAHNPTVPIDNIVANINMDELPMVFDFKDVVPLGAEHSSLGPMIDSITKAEGLEVSPDPLPEENFFVRSDQYSLVKEGVPAVAIGGGEKAVDPAKNGGEIERAWIKTYYHSPQDDMSQPLDFNAAAKYTRLNFALGFAVANQDARPTWNPGDFFGNAFGRHNAATGAAGQH
jgi:Zn-dependent M28 family amino/carboxypeptidase